MNDFGFYNADCMEHLKDFPDKFFDLAIVDPPYGINVFRTANETRSARAKSKAYKKYAGGDMNAPDPEYFRQLQRISRNQIIFGANHFIDNIAAGYSGGWRPRVGSYGTRKTVRTISPIANLPSHHFRRRFGYSASGGRVCFRVT